MSTQLKLRRGTTAQHSTFTGAEGEVTVDTDKDTLVVHDGTTAGGVPVASTKVANSFTADQVVNGLTVGRGAGAVSTNTAVGASALAANTTGSQSVAVGTNALAAQTSGVDNVAIGVDSLAQTTTGLNNSAIGTRSLWSNTTGQMNTGLGRNALRLNTTGNYNTAQGVDALFSNTTSSNNTAVGYRAGYSQTTGGTYAANTFVGQLSGEASTGDINTFVGAGSGKLVTTGSRNTVLGAYNGNQGGLDIRTASNYIVLSDGDGNPRLAVDSSGNFKSTGTGSATLYPDYACRAWVNFNGTGTVAIRASGNVSSITDNGTGQYTVNFTNALPDGNYAAVSMAGQYGGGVNATLGFDIDNNIRTTTAYRFFSVIPSNPTVTTDIANVTMAFFR